MKLSTITKKTLHFPTLPVTGIIAGLRHFSGELTDPPPKPLPLPLPPPFSEIASLLKTTDQNDWTSNPKLLEFINTPPSPTSFLKITRQLGSTDKALQFFEFVKAHNSSPSYLSFTFQAVLEQAMRDQSSSADVASKLCHLFTFAKDREIPLSINAATLLIRCFGRAKMLEESISVFNELDVELRNTNVVNLLLDCLLRGGDIDHGFKVLDEMLERESSFTPNESTMDIVLSAVWKRNLIGGKMSVEESFELVVRFFEHGVFLDDVWCTKLITKFCRSGKCDKAWDLLHDMMRLGGQVETASFNALLSGLGRERDFQKMNLLVNEMREKGVKLNVVTFGILINHLCKSYRVDEALKVFGKMGGSDNDGVLVKPDLVLYNTLIDGLCKVGRQEEGFKLMEKMRQESENKPNTVTYNCLIDGFCKAGEIERAYELFEQMKKEVVPNVITLNTLLDGMCRHGRVNSAMQLLGEMQEKGVKGNAITYTILITSFCSVNNIDKAMTLFMEMSGNGCFPDAKVYYSLILGLCQARRIDDASSVASKAKEAGFGLDIICYNALIGGFCRKNKIDEAHKILRDMEEAGLTPDRYTYNTLISYFSEKGQFKTAHSIMKRMIDDGLLPNVVTYGALIHAYCLAGNLDEAMKIFENMRSAVNVSPNTVIYNILIDTLCKSDKVENALSLLADMKDKGVRPNTVTYNAIFKGLQEKNWVEKAYEIMDQMTENACNPDYITMEVLTQWLSDVGETEKLQSFVQGYEVSTSTA